MPCEGAHRSAIYGEELGQKTGRTYRRRRYSEDVLRSYCRCAMDR